MKMRNIVLDIILIAILLSACSKQQSPRIIQDFNADWDFFLGEDTFISGSAQDMKKVNLPHDWSIEGEFSNEHPTTERQGALPAGMGWYKKEFTPPGAVPSLGAYAGITGEYRGRPVDGSAKRDAAGSYVESLS